MRDSITHFFNGIHIFCKTGDKCHVFLFCNRCAKYFIVKLTPV
jgi:hypothetical protein